MTLCAFAFSIVGSALVQSPHSVGSSSWECAPLTRKSLVPSAVVWERLNCSGTAFNRAVGPLVFNVVTTQLAAPGIRVVPVAGANHSLHTVPELVGPNAVAAINGGYFWRVDETSLWVDDVCVGKTRAEALRNASLDEPDAGVGDSLLVADGHILASNCDRPGNSRLALGRGLRH